MSEHYFPDIPPYTGVSFDRIKKHRLADGTHRSFRIIAYKGINGYVGEPPAVAVFDDDFGLVLNDAMFVDEDEAARHVKAVQLAEMGFEPFRQAMNAELGVRHQLDADGTIPWHTVDAVLKDFDI